MALGGGNFLTQNKVLPGSYINFVSAASSNANISDRGYAAVAVELGWGEEEKMTYQEIIQQVGKQIEPTVFYYDDQNKKIEIDRDTS